MGGVAPLRRACALGVPLRGGEVWARACSRGSCGRERMRRRARSARGGGAVRSGGPGDRVGVEAAEHAPAVPQEPRLGGARDGGAARGETPIDAIDPAGEGVRRRARVQPVALETAAALERVLACVVQRVEQAVADLARSRQRARVVAPREERSLATEALVDVLRDPDLQACDAARETDPIVGLHDQVDVVAQDRELDDAKPLLAALADAAPDDLGERWRAQRWQAIPNPQRHVQGIAPRVKWSPPMRHASPPAGFCSGAATAAAPAEHPQLELLSVTRVTTSRSSTHRAFIALA